MFAIRSVKPHDDCETPMINSGYLFAKEWSTGSVIRRRVTKFAESTFEVRSKRHVIATSQTQHTIVTMEISFT
jgi:hypothetical protein